MTTEYSAREVRESRAAGSLRKRLASMILSPPPEHQLSAMQVETIFMAYLPGRPCGIPQSGA